MIGPGTTAHVDWAGTNRDVLLAELDVVRCHLRREAVPDALVDVLEEKRAALDRPAAIDAVAEGFGLTAFERAVLLLAAGPELVVAVADELTATGGDPRPTFGLAFSHLPDPQWGALSPTAPLRRWRLILPLDPSSPTRSPLSVDERVLHHLLGVGYPEPELAAVARPVAAPAALPPTLDLAATEVAAAWSTGRPATMVAAQHANLAPVAAAAAGLLGRSLMVVAAADLPRAPTDRDRVLRLVERESVLGRSAWAIDLIGARPEDTGPLLRALHGVDAPVVLLGGDDDGAGGLPAQRVHVPRLPMPERLAVLGAAVHRHSGAVGGGTPAEEVVAAAATFDLSVPDAESAAAESARGLPLWTACRHQARRRFDALARVVEPRAGWDDLVLPATQLEQLRALVAAVRYRATVLDSWGFGDRLTRGVGTAALFAGPSGTGKSTAAEVIAGALDLDLVVVDLSQVVSKYIGETEKNLGAVFDAAEDSAAVLLFDEADTLFGKRTEVRDSHDRYANLEVGYLLQRMESFRGLAILTTNARSVLDSAFLRRLRVIVTFPYPDPAARAAMWQRAFPAGTPTEELDVDRLAAIDLPGGGIAAAALTAAYLGAERGEVSREDVAAATRWELAKNGRTLTSP